MERKPLAYEQRLVTDYPAMIFSAIKAGEGVDRPGYPVKFYIDAHHADLEAGMETRARVLGAILVLPESIAPADAFQSDLIELDERGIAFAIGNINRMLEAGQLEKTGTDEGLASENPEVPSSGPSILDVMEMIRARALPETDRVGSPGVTVKPLAGDLLILPTIKEALVYGSRVKEDPE